MLITVLKIIENISCSRLMKKFVNVKDVSVTVYNFYTFNVIRLSVHVIINTLIITLIH